MLIRRSRSRVRTVNGSLMEAGGCTGSYMSMHLLALNLETDAEWTVGSEATVCHDLRTPAWSENGSELVVPYGPSNLPAGTTEVPGAGGFDESCLEPQPAGLAIVQAGSSSQFSPSALIEPAAGCSYESAVFDSEGILAVEGCSEGSPAVPEALTLLWPGLSRSAHCHGRSRPPATARDRFQPWHRLERPRNRDHPRHGRSSRGAAGHEQERRRLGLGIPQRELAPDQALFHRAPGLRQTVVRTAAAN